jgi:hypothetical protein
MSQPGLAEKLIVELMKPPPTSTEVFVGCVAVAAAVAVWVAVELGLGLALRRAFQLRGAVEEGRPDAASEG